MMEPVPPTTSRASRANRPTVQAWQREVRRCLAGLLPPGGAPGVSLWTQLFMLPVTTFVYGLGFMARALQAVQQTAQQVVANPNVGSPLLAGGELGRSTPIGGAPRGNATTSPKEVREMSDCGCNSHCHCGEKFCEVRVYEYYILSVRPCHERVVFGPTSVVITSNMSGEAFSTYAVALYCRGREITQEEAKYLRVCYRINCTFPKEDKDCCKDSQTDVLREIKDVLQQALGSGQRPPGGTGGATTSAAEAPAAAA